MTSLRVRDNIPFCSLFAGARRWPEMMMMIVQAGLFHQEFLSWIIIKHWIHYYWRLARMWIDRECFSILFNTTLKQFPIITVNGTWYRAFVHLISFRIIRRKFLREILLEFYVRDCIRHLCKIEILLETIIWNYLLKHHSIIMQFINMYTRKEEYHCLCFQRVSNSVPVVNDIIVGIIDDCNLFTIQWSSTRGRFTTCRVNRLWKRNCFNLTRR